MTTTKPGRAFPPILLAVGLAIAAGAAVSLPRYLAVGLAAAFVMWSYALGSRRARRLGGGTAAELAAYLRGHSKGFAKGLREAADYVTEVQGRPGPASLNSIRQVLAERSKRAGR